MESLISYKEEFEIKEKVKNMFKPLINEDGLFVEDFEGVVSELKGDVDTKNNKVMLLVHPFFEDTNGIPKQYEEIYKESDIFRDNLARFNDEAEKWLSDTKIPTIILEQRSTYEATINHLSKKNIIPQNRIYTIPTFQGMGTPLMSAVGTVHPMVFENHRKWVEKSDKEGIKPSEVIKELDDQYNHTTWIVLKLILEKVGAKHVYMGGKYIDIREINGEKSLGRCLGEAYDRMDFIVHELKEDSDMVVELTDATFPLQPKDLKGIPLSKGDVF